MVIARYTYFDSIQVASIMLLGSAPHRLDRPEFCEIINVTEHARDPLDPHLRPPERRLRRRGGRSRPRRERRQAGPRHRRVLGRTPTRSIDLLPGLDPDAGLYVRIEPATAAAGQCTLIATANIINDPELIDDGNAALTFNTIGGSDRVVFVRGQLRLRRPASQQQGLPGLHHAHHAVVAHAGRNLHEHLH